MKTRPVGAGLFQADGRRDGWTNITKLVVTFRNFANAPNIKSLHVLSARECIMIAVSTVCFKG
jgi:hypothetical protein